MNKNDFMGGVVFVGLGISILILTIPFPSLDKDHPGPSLFPNILAILFIFFGSILLVKAKKSTPAQNVESSQGKGGPSRNSGNAFFVLGIIVAFMLLESWFGFLLTSSLLLFLMMKKLGTSSAKSLIFSIPITLFVYFLFHKILRVPLSPGFLSW